MKQADAVYKIVAEVLEDSNTTLTSDTVVSLILSEDEKQQIIAKITEGLKDGSIDMTEKSRSKKDTDAKLKNYASGLLSNQLRKDKKLNGGTAYVPKNPGSRVGLNDPEIKNLRMLLKTGHLSEEQEKDAKAYLDKKINALNAAKLAEFKINKANLKPEVIEALKNAGVNL